MAHLLLCGGRSTAWAGGSPDRGADCERPCSFGFLSIEGWQPHDRRRWRGHAGQRRRQLAALEHFSGKACPGLDRGGVPVFAEKMRTRMRRTTISAFRVQEPDDQQGRRRGSFLGARFGSTWPSAFSRFLRPRKRGNLQAHAVLRRRCPGEVFANGHRGSVRRDCATQRPRALRRQPPRPRAVAARRGSCPSCHRTKWHRSKPRRSARRTPRFPARQARPTSLRSDTRRPLGEESLKGLTPEGCAATRRRRHQGAPRDFTTYRRWLFCRTRRRRKIIRLGDTWTTLRYVNRG